MNQPHATHCPTQQQQDCVARFLAILGQPSRRLPRNDNEKRGRA